MGYVKEERAEKILEESLLSKLHDGVVPEAAELEHILREKIKAFGDLSWSSLRHTTPPARFSASSASEFSDAIEAIDDDRGVILSVLDKINKLSSFCLSDWNSRAKGLTVRLNKLLIRVESLVLMESESAGYTSFVEDGFYSLEKVSSDTTANIDTTTGEVTLSIDRTSADPASGGTRIDLSKALASYSIISSREVKESQEMEGNIGEILSDIRSRWTVEIITKPPAEFSGGLEEKALILEVKIGLEELKEVSKISVITATITAGGPDVITIQYSEDGYTWTKVPTESYIQSGIGNFIFRFDKTEMKWVKILMSKASPDSSLSFASKASSGPTLSGFKYLFGLEQVKLFKEDYSISEEGEELQTETLYPIIGGAPVSFGRVALEVCEEVPDKTSLRYQLRAYDGSSYTNWITASPISREESMFPAVIDFSAPLKYSSEDLTTVFDNTLNTESLNLLRVQGSGDLSYRFNGPSDTVTNFYMPNTSDLVSDLVFLRNIGYSDGKYPTINSDLKVADIECGWMLEGKSLYSCQFQVKNPDGMEINFGHTQATLDRKVVSGIVSILPGWHSFQTSRANWAPLSFSLFTSVPTTLAELEAGDPLYPYNHKYLIEGYNYPAGFDGEEIYPGVDIYTQQIGTRIGTYTLLNSDVDLSIYALDTVSGGNTIVLLKVDPTKASHVNERVRLSYSRRFDSYTSIQLKAILKSREAGRTPVLSYYRIKVK